MTLLEVGLGVGLAIVCIWSIVLYLLQMIKIEKLEEEINGCEKDNKILNTLYGIYGRKK